MNYDHLSEFERLYTPPLWCKKYQNPNDCAEHFIKTSEIESKLVRRNIPGEFDIPYGASEKEKYDIIGTDLPDRAPIVFFTHGGYWQAEMVNRLNSSFIAKVLHQHGIKCFVIGYELCPKVNLEQIVMQTQKAFTACLNYAKTKGSSGICIMGHSAGAHLVSCFFNGFLNTFPDEDKQLFKTAFLVGGLFELSPIIKTCWNDLPKLTTITAEKFSPIRQDVPICDTKIFVVVGINECPGFMEQNKEFDEYLKGKGITSELIVLENSDHCESIIDIIYEETEFTKLVLKTIKKYN